MILQDFKPFIGEHCETTAVGSLLWQEGIELSEPMLFGLGESLGYIFWKMKIMDFPFMGGRVKPDQLTENLCKNLNLKLEVKETSSLKKAWQNVSKELDRGKAVGLKLDCYHLEYFTTKIHFAGHYVAMYGYDNENAFLVDTKQQGTESVTSLENLALARNEKGSMASKNLSFIIEKEGPLPNLKSAIKSAIKNNAEAYLNPPITNFCYKGIRKTATEIKKWFASSKDIKGDFTTSAMLLERAGTGGALFRNIYRDFLNESLQKHDVQGLEDAHLQFIDIAVLWTEISKLFDKIGETQEVSYVNQASEILIELSEKEKRGMELLLKAVS